MMAQASSESPNVNPYAPTIGKGDKALLGRLERYGPVTTFSFFLHALTGIILSGGAFGLCLGLFVLVMSGGPSEAWLMLPLGALIGCIVASVSGTLTLAILLLLHYWFASEPMNWHASRINKMSALTGAISGFAAVWGPTGFAVEVLIVGVITGCFGLAGGLIGTHRCVARARKFEADQERKEFESTGETTNPLSLDHPSS